MPNLLLTDYCNQSCSYCFAKEKVSLSKNTPRAKHYMDWESVNLCIDYLKRSNLKIFSILGGEPTLHPFFNDIIDKVIEEGFDLKIFSNGFMPDSVRDHLAEMISESKNFEIIVNVNNPDSLTENESITLFKTLESLHRVISLSYNIWNVKLGFSFLIDYINDFALKKHIRLGLAQPIFGSNNEYLETRAYSLMGKNITDFSDDCSKHNIILGFDCGFVLCMFNERQIGKLILNNTHFMIVCDSVIDISPDLNVWRCFPLSKSSNVRLSDFKTESEIKQFYHDRFKGYRRFGIFDKCFSCKYLFSGQCTGGCIGHKIRQFSGNLYG
jgi:MoaA/NifB/PqqE/SkfB family radical SAM enzyme